MDCRKRGDLITVESAESSAAQRRMRRLAGCAASMKLAAAMIGSLALPLGVCALLLSNSVYAAQKPTPKYLEAAIADPARPASDTQRDEAYKPAAVLTFAGVRPGVKVADFMAGDGYYSRLFSKIVSPTGYVYAYYTTEEDSPAIKRGAKVGKALSSYDNVGIVHGPVEKFVAPEKLDVVWTGLTYHDLFNQNFKGVDINAVNRAVFASLKPGGTYFVLDRAARPGTGLGDLPALLRIDEAVVKTQIEAAGFQFVGESSILRNPADDHTSRVTKADFKTMPDQFLLKFRKPLH